MARGHDRGVFEKQKGSKVWWIRYACQYGHLHREKIGPKGLAKAEYERQRVRARREGYCPTQERNKPRPVQFQDMAEEYLRWAKVNHRGYREDVSRMSRLVAAFRGKTLDEITVRDVEAFKAKLAAQMSPASVNRHLALLKHLFTLGIQWGKATKNPAKSVRLFKENNARVRYLTADEEARLFQVCPDRYKPFVSVALHTGFRKGELLGLRWRDVDFEAGVLTVERSKHGEAKRVPMNSRVVEILKTLPRTSPHVFPPEQYQWISQTFPAIVRKAKVEDFHFHDLRHTFASRLAMAGVDMLTIKELGGWKTLGMVIRYTHLSPDHKRAAVERLISAATGTATSTDEKSQLSEADKLLEIESLR